MREERIIRKAEFNPRVCPYWLLSGAVVLAVTIVGIPLIPIWLVFGLALTRRYLASMECILTAKSLKIKKGILVRVEKTVPLAKITDMGMVQGPIMRQFDLHQLTVETAGQSGQGALVSLTGVVDALDFREAVLAQSEEVADAVASEPRERGSGAADAVLLEIRDTLLRIEQQLTSPR